MAQPPGLISRTGQKCEHYAALATETMQELVQSSACWLLPGGSADKDIKRVADGVELDDLPFKLIQPQSAAH